MLPPARAVKVISPAGPTTIGIVRVTFAATVAARDVFVNSTRGLRATSSAASSGSRDTSLSAKRSTMSMVRAGTQPSLASASLSGPLMFFKWATSPRRAGDRIASKGRDSCVRTLNGHAIIVPPRPMLNSRRLTPLPHHDEETELSDPEPGTGIRVPTCPRSSYASTSGPVRRTPRTLRFPTKSLLSMRSTSEERMLFDDLVGAPEECWRNAQSQRIGSPQVDDQPEDGRTLDGKFRRLGALEYTVNIARGSLHKGDVVSPVRKQCPSLSIERAAPDNCNPLFQCQRRNLSRCLTIIEARHDEHKQCVDRCRLYAIEGLRKCRASRLNAHECKPQRGRGRGEDPRVVLQGRKLRVD